MEGHPAAEGMAENDDGALHVDEDLTHGLRVRSGPPRVGWRRGRPESGKVERQRR